MAGLEVVLRRGAAGAEEGVFVVSSALLSLTTRARFVYGKRSGRRPQEVGTAERAVAFNRGFGVQVGEV